jgi:hypothetical protein
LHSAPQIAAKIPPAPSAGGSPFTSPGLAFKLVKFPLIAAVDPNFGKSISLHNDFFLSVY